MPLGELVQGEGDHGLAQAFALVGGANGDPVDQAILLAVEGIEPGADGADADPFGAGGDEGAPLHGLLVVAVFGDEGVVFHFEPVLGVAFDVEPEGAFVGAHGADAEAIGKGDVGDVAQVRADHVDAVAGGADLGPADRCVGA